MSTTLLNQSVNLLHETGMLAKIPRSGFAFLGSGSQSVAEHSYRMTIIAYTLSSLFEDTIDNYKLMMMCLFHDFPETRIGDLNYVQKSYVTPHTENVLKDLKKMYPLREEFVDWIQEYEEALTLEAKIAHDADQLELLLMLKEEEEKGNLQAKEWSKNCYQRLKTNEGKMLASAIDNSSSQTWWKNCSKK